MPLSPSQLDRLAETADPAPGPDALVCDVEGAVAEAERRLAVLHEVTLAVNQPGLSDQEAAVILLLPFLAPERVARALCVSVRTVYRLRRSAEEKIRH
jgi:DNA-directed RNA polymerase specialized sigma24 family protein